MDRHIGGSAAIFESVESRKLLAVSVVQGHPALLVDGDGSQLVMTLNGPGSATTQIVSGRLDLSTSGTTSASVLSIDITGGDGRATSRRLNFRRPIGSFTVTSCSSPPLASGAW